MLRQQMRKKMSITKKIRTIPQVDDLGDIQTFINLIGFYKIPWSDLETRTLDEEREKGNVSENVCQQIIDWKKANGMKIHKGWWSDRISLLNLLGIITKSLSDCI